MVDYKRFEDYLRGEHLKMTPQRQAVFRAFRESRGQVSPAEIFTSAKGYDSSLSLATVYRTMKLLSGAGLAHEMRMGENVVRYERQSGAVKHDHFVCLSCRKDMTLEDLTLNEVGQRLTDRYGIEVESLQLFVYGVCRTCLEKKKKPQV